MSSCRRRRHLPLEHVLVAGGAEDVEAMRALLALLPGNAYGQVFLELDEEASVGQDVDLRTLLPTPPRITLTRLVAGRPAPSPQPLAAPRSALQIEATQDLAGSPVLATRGVLLAEAVAAWSAEWIPAEPTVERLVSIWVGSRTSDAVNALCARLPHPVERF